MAYGVRFCFVWILLTLLLKSLILNSLNPNDGLDIKINGIFLAKRLDVRHYPTRNSGLSRRFVCESRVPSTLKCMAGIKLANITAYADTLVILSGDVALNPGPVKDPCAICQKGCRQNQKAIQCDLCDEWIHAKCIGMNNTEYRELSNPSMSWQCIKCLFPACDSPVRNPPKKTCRKNGANQGIELNPNLKKRGMKFAHVNIATLIGHYTDMEVLLDEAKVDVFAVTESRLDSTILASQICPPGYVCYRKKDRNRNGGGCAVFVKNKRPSKRRIDLEVDSLEMVCVEICPDKAKKYYLYSLVKH